MRRVLAVTVKLVKEIFSDDVGQTGRRISLDPGKEVVCDECDCDCYECRAKQNSAGAKVPA